MPGKYEVWVDRPSDNKYVDNGTRQYVESFEADSIEEAQEKLKDYKLTLVPGGHRDP